MQAERGTLKYGVEQKQAGNQEQDLDQLHDDALRVRVTRMLLLRSSIVRKVQAQVQLESRCLVDGFDRRMPASAKRQ